MGQLRELAVDLRSLWKRVNVILNECIGSAVLESYRPIAFAISVLEASRLSSGHFEDTDEKRELASCETNLR